MEIPIQSTYMFLMRTADEYDDCTIARKGYFI